MSFLFIKSITPSIIRFTSTSVLTCSPSTRSFASAPSFKSQPSPPPLPKEDQEEFEKLQKEASKQRFTTSDEPILHPQFRKVYEDFEGDVNPQTGEIGGPKQDPLRHGDYSFNGRVTDF